MNVHIGFDFNKSFPENMIIEDNSQNDKKQNNREHSEDFQEKLNEELKNFYNDLISVTEDNEELKKIQELILYLKSSEKDQTSEIKCTYYIGEMIDNIQYLKTTNSIYNVGLIFDLFSKVSNSLNDKSNVDFLLKVYNEIQSLIEQISLTPERQLEVSLLNFNENKNFIIKIIILLETSKIVNHYKKILRENSLISATQKIHNPNPLINLSSIERSYRECKVPSKIAFLDFVEFQVKPLTMFKFTNANFYQNNQYNKEYFFIK